MEVNSGSSLALELDFFMDLAISQRAEGTLLSNVAGQWPTGLKVVGQINHVMRDIEWQERSIFRGQRRILPEHLSTPCLAQPTRARC